ncbi:MAG: hypothetical protein AB8B69_21505 [Chitinophagales bacterium]
MRLILWAYIEGGSNDCGFSKGGECHLLVYAKVIQFGVLDSVNWIGGLKF